MPGIDASRFGSGLSKGVSPGGGFLAQGELLEFESEEDFDSEGALLPSPDFVSVAPPFPVDPAVADPAPSDFLA